MSTTSFLNPCSMILLMQNTLIARWCSRVRTRFAPSPTGQLHIGSLRTALYNYLFAKKNSGSMVLRIEDTDSTRNVVDGASKLEQALLWCGITWDEGGLNQQGAYGPYQQSKRTHIYQSYINRLITTKHAYFCNCQPPAEKSKEKAVQCRCLQNQANVKQSESVVKFKIDQTKKEVGFDDQVYGRINTKTMVMKDFAVTRAGGQQALFVLANLVDDFQMQISHVIRGEQFLTLTPKQILLGQALGLAMPKYAHLPLIADQKTSKKLSKRRTDSTIEEYREKGICSQAIINYTAFLGFSPLDNNEAMRNSMLGINQLIPLFELKAISRTPVKFDRSRLMAYNKMYWLHYLNHNVKNSQEAERFKQLLLAVYGHFSTQIQVMNERQILALRECAERYPFGLHQLQFAFVRASPTALSGGHGSLIKALLSSIPSQQFTQKTVLSKFNEYFAVNPTIKPNDLYAELRMRLSGKSEGPGATLLCQMLGKEEVLARML